MPSLRRPGCVIYSCGLDEDLAFEVQMARTTRCEVFAFDPSPLGRRWVGYLVATADPPLPRNLHFLPWGWAEKEAVVEVDPWSGVELTGKCSSCFWRWNTSQWGQPSAKWRMMRLSTIARRLNHTKVDLVKMNCEGAEYAKGFVDDLVALKPDQLVFEQHPFTFPIEGSSLGHRQVTSAEWVAFRERLHRDGLRQVWHGRRYADLYDSTFVRRELTNLARRHANKGG